MPTELIKLGTASGLGTILGAVGSFYAYKWRIAATEKSLNDLEKDVVYKDVCSVCKTGHNKDISSIEKMLKEVRDDIKKLLERRSDNRNDCPKVGSGCD